MKKLLLFIVTFFIVAEIQAQCPVTITPTPTSVCIGATTTLTASGGTTYTWSSNAGGVNTAAVSVTPLQNTIYTVTATTGTCVATQTVAIMVFSQPNLTATANPVSVCPGGTSVLTASGATSYTWSNNAGGGNNATATATLTPAAYTTYTVIGSNGICADTQVVSVSISPVPTISVSAIPLNVCAGGTATLTASGASTYTWNTGATGPTTVVTPASTTVYTVMGTNSSGCADTQVVTVGVIPFISLAISAAPTGVCAGGSSTLTASGASSYSWSANAGGVITPTTVVNPISTTVYTVTGFSGSCVATQTVAIPIVNSISVSIAPGTATVCAGTTIVLTASGASAYSWSQGGVTTSTIAVTPYANSVYGVTGTSAGCTATQTVAVSVNPAPSIFVTASPSSMCTGGATSILTASGATSYTWSANAGAVTTATAAVNPPATTVYTVTGSNGTCTSTNTVTVNILPSLSIAASANPTGICVGGTATLTASGAASYTWSANAGSVNTSVVSVSPTVSTIYTVTGTSGQCVSSQTVNVSIVPSLTVTTTANPSSICGPASSTLTAYGASAYSWSANAGGATTQSVVVAPTSTTVYTVTASSGGCSATQTVAITVNSFSLTIAPPVGTTTFCTNNPYQFTGNANPGPILFWQWKCAPTTGVSIQYPNQNGTNITFANAGTYTLTLIANNSLGCRDSVLYPLTVAPTPTISNAPASPWVCQGGTGTHLYVSGASTYTWSPQLNISSVYGNGDSVLINPPNTGVYSYTVIGTLGGCNSAPSVITATVDPPPQPLITYKDSICSQTSTTITANGMPAFTTYTWSAAPNAGVGTNSGFYTPATPIYGGAADTSFQYYLNINVPGCPAYPTYTVYLTVLPTPTVHVVSDTVDNCNKTGDSLKANTIPGAGVTCIWSPAAGLNTTIGNPVFANPANPATYYVTPTLNGCVGKRDSVKVRIGDSTYAQITPLYLIMCSGDTNYLVANPALSQLNNSYQYSWAPSIGIAGASSNNDTLFINPSSTIIYTLTVKGTCVKRHTDEVTIAVNNCVTPIANYTVSSDTICTNKCVYYTDLTQNYTVRPLFYMWVFTGGSVVGPCPRCIIRNDTVLYTAADSLPIPNIHVCYHVNSQLNNNGVFPVEEDVWAGVPKGTNFSKATGSIKVDPAPLAHAEYQGGGINQNATINLGDVITLDATHSSGNFGVSSYTWSPSSTLSCTNCPNPVANPTTTTYYYLTVEDKSTGCVSTDSMTVYVDFQCFDPFIPTAFSPNGDGYNDVLYVRSNCLTNFTFRIYDRWGEKVFETSDISSGWDGSFRGQPMNAGVFVYTFDGYLTTNKEVKKHGNITLVK